MFDKENLKYSFIWSISLFFAIAFKSFGHFNPDTLLINNYLVLLLVFGPALLVTMVIAFDKILKT